MDITTFFKNTIFYLKKIAEGSDDGGQSTIDLSTAEGLLGDLSTKLDNLTTLSTEVKQDTQISQFQDQITKTIDVITAVNTQGTNLFGKEEEVKQAVLNLGTQLNTLNSSITSSDSNSQADTTSIISAINQFSTNNGGDINILNAALITKLNELKTLTQTEFDELQVIANKAFNQNTFRQYLIGSTSSQQVGYNGFKKLSFDVIEGTVDLTIGSTGVKTYPMSGSNVFITGATFEAEESVTENYAFLVPANSKVLITIQS